MDTGKPPIYLQTKSDEFLTKEAARLTIKFIWSWIDNEFWTSCHRMATQDLKNMSKISNYTLKSLLNVIIVQRLSIPKYGRYSPI